VVPLLLAVVFLSTSISAQTIYSQDFSSNPNYVSLASDYAYWDSSQGNYYVKTRDDLKHKYWAYSPYIGNIDPTKEDYKIKFDIMIENQDWGTYPNIRFCSDKPTEMNNGACAFSLSNANSDNSRENFRACTSGSSPATCINTSQWTVKNNTWYSVEFETKENGSKINLTIKDKSSGIAIGEFNDIDFPITQFSYIGFGYYDQPNYGSSYAPMRIDNIEITSNNSSPCTSAEAGTISPDLNIHMPSLEYQGVFGKQNMWVDFEYLGTNTEGKPIWTLKDYGVNQ